MPFEFGSSRVIEVVVATDDDLSAQIGSTRVFNLIDFAQVRVGGNCVCCGAVD
jgi:hypothetical protein